LEAATQLSDRALHLARALKDSAAESRILWTQMRALSMSDPHKAVEAGEASLALARSLGLREQVAFTLNDLPYGYLGAGRLPDALRVLEEARQSWTESDNQPMLADNLASTAALLVLVGEFDQGFHLARESLEIAERIGNLWGQAYARMPMSQAYYLLGDLGAAIVCLRQCLKLAEPAGFLDPQVTMRSLHGVCLAMAGDAQAGLAEVKRAESLAKINYVRLIGTTIAARTLVLTLAGDLDGALREAEDLARVAGPGGLMLEETSFLAGFAAAEVDVLRRDPDHLLALIDRFDTFVERFHVGAFRFCLSMYRGVALTQKGQWEDAAKHLEAAVRAMGTVGADLAQWRPYAALAEVRERQGQAVEARRCHVEAASRLERIVSGLPEERLQRLFKARADVRRELQAAA
jgi:tetratricopeptide (TPR) repeat protein